MYHLKCHGYLSHPPQPVPAEELTPTGPIAARPMVLDACGAGLAKDEVNPLGEPAPKTIAAISLLQIFILTLLEKLKCATQRFGVLTCYPSHGNNCISDNPDQKNNKKAIS